MRKLVFLVLLLSLLVLVLPNLASATAIQLGSLTGANVTYPTVVSISATSSNTNDADVNYSLWRNNTLVASHLGSSTLVDTTQLGAAWYRYNYTASSGANYTANSTNLTLGINVSRAPSAVLITLTGNNSVYPISTTGTCSLTTGDSGTSLTLTRNSTSPYTNTSANPSETTTLMAGHSNYTCTYPLTQNYTASSSVNQNMFIQQGASVLLITLTGNNSAYNSPTNSVCSLTTGDSGTSLTLTRNATAYTNSTTSPSEGLLGTLKTNSLNAGHSNYTCTYPATQNYTAGSALNQNLFISQTTPTLTIAGISNSTYQYTETISTTSNDINGLSLTFVRNGTVNANNSAITYPAGLWNFTSSTPANQNYTSSSSSSWNLVSQGIMNITLMLNGTAANTSYTYPAATNATANMSTIFGESAYNMTLLRDGVSKASTISATSISENILLGAATYNYTLLWSSANYTVSNISTNRFAIVNPATFTIDLFLNGTAANKFYPNTSFANFSTVTNITTNTTPITLHLDTNISGISNWVNITNTSTVIQNTSLWNSGVDSAYNVTAYITPNSNYTSNSSSWYFMQDVSPPIYANQTNVNSSVVFAAGGQAHQFNISVFDRFVGEQSALLEFNSVNYTASNTTGTSSGDVFYYTLFGLPVGVYQYKWYVNDTFGHTNTTSVSTYTVSASTDNGGSSGGSETTTITTTTHAPSGGGSASPPPAVSNTPVAQETEVLHKVIAGEPSSVNISDSNDLKVQEITLVLNRTVSNVQLSIVEVPKPSANIVITTPSGSVYKYLQISKMNIQDSDVINATITFKVEKSWLSSNNIDKSTVILNRLVNGSWTQLPTSATSEDSSFVYYTALSPGFSYFAITGSKSVQTTSPPPSPPAETTTTTTEATPVLTASQPNYTIVYVLLVLAVIIAAGFFVYRNQKHKKQ